MSPAVDGMRPSASASHAPRANIAPSQVPHTSGAQLQLDATDRATAQLIWKAGVGEEVPQLLPLGQGRPAVVWRRGNFTFEPAVVDAKTVKRHMRGMDGCMHM